jgi:hypothetical protein
MVVVPFQTSSTLGYGLVSPQIPVVGVPEGCTVARIRSRPDEFIRVYLRTPDGFEAWSADFTDADHSALRLTHLIGQNIRPLASRPAPLAFSR